MKLLKLGAILLAAPLMWSLQAGSVQAQSEVELKEMQKKAMSYYDILYPNDTLKDLVYERMSVWRKVLGHGRTLQTRTVPNVLVSSETLCKA